MCAEIVLTAALATAFVVVTAMWGTKVVSRIFPHFHSRLRADEAQFDVAMILLFSLAVLAFYAGVAAIVGAFLAGLALAGSADSRVRNLTRGVTELLVPFFLVGIGLNFDIGIFRSRVDRVARAGDSGCGHRHKGSRLRPGDASGRMAYRSACRCRHDSEG